MFNINNDDPYIEWNNSIIEDKVKNQLSNYVYGCPYNMTIMYSNNISAFEAYTKHLERIEKLISWANELINPYLKHFYMKHLTPYKATTKSNIDRVEAAAKIESLLLPELPK